MSKELKLCAGAWGFREREISEYLDACRRLGFRFAEMNLTDSPGAKHLPPKPSRSQLAAMARAEEAAGVKVVCLCPGNDFTASDPDELRASIADAKANVDVAADCGAQVVRVFGGWAPFGALSDGTYQRCAGALAETGEYAQEKGVLVALENHGGIAATGAQVRRLLELADHPNVKANYDGGNFAKDREDPLSAYLVLRDRVGYTHWKDVRIEERELAYCALGDGITNWAPVVAALLQDAYDGYWTMEYEEPSDVEEGMKKCAREILRLSGGSGTSLTGS